MAKTFKEYFRESLDAATPGLPSPDALFGTAEKAVASIGTMLAYLKSIKFDNSITIGMMFRAWPAFSATAAGATAQTGAVLEVSGAVGALGAAYYVGACLGALIYATGSVLGDSIGAGETASIKGLQNRAAQLGIEIPHESLEMLAHNTNLLTQRRLA